MRQFFRVFSLCVRIGNAHPRSDAIDQRDVLLRILLTDGAIDFSTIRRQEDIGGPLTDVELLNKLGSVSDVDSYGDIVGGHRSFDVWRTQNISFDFRAG